MKSQFGERETVGSTYLEAQKNSTDGLTIGDINEDIAKHFVEDLNDAIASNSFDGRPFYINVVEERDLQMKNAIKRRLFLTLYRPYPEDNTLVFYVETKENRVSYCWDMPHHSELPNILSNEYQYDHEYIRSIKQWLHNDLSGFGFIKVTMDNSSVEGYEKETINAYRKCYEIHCKSMEMDAKSLENEIKLGFFWIPNKLYKDKIMGMKEHVSSLILPGIKEKIPSLILP